MSSFEEQNTQSIDYWQVIRNHWGIIILTFILAVVTAFVTTTLIKPTYMATTTFEVHPDRLIVDSASASGGLTQMIDRAFFGNQIIAMTSPEVLKRVDEGKEVRQFSKGLGEDYEIALGRLANRISVDVVSADSTVFAVSVLGGDRAEAKQLANKIRTGYERHRKEGRKSLRGETYKKQEAQLKIAQTNKDSLYDQLVASSKKANLPFTPDSLAELKNQAKEEYDLKRSQRIAKQESMRAYEAEATEVLKKNDDELIAYLATSGAIIERAGLFDISKTIKSLEEDRSTSMIDGLGPNHPRIQQIDTLITLNERELKTALESVRESVVERLKLEKAEIKQIEESIASLKDDFDDYTKTFVQHERLIQDFQLARQEVITLRQELQSTYFAGNFLNEPIVLHRSATLPGKPISPNVPLIMGVGATAGLVFGLSIAFLLEIMDTSVKTMEDVEKFLELPVLAVVPQDVGLLHTQKAATPDVEAYRIMRTNIEFNRKNPDDNSFTVVSGGAGEGKSTTLLNLAYICAQGGYTTLVIDADLRRPRLHSYLGVDNVLGLSNYLTTDATLENVVVKTDVDNMFFLSSGILPQDAAGILNSRRMTELIKEVKSRFDLVLVDSPPILGVSDASVISSEVDHTIIVVQHRKLPRKLLLRVKQAVLSVGGNIIGVVLNNVDVRSDTEYQYYTSYYTYYSPSAIKESNRLAKQADGKSENKSDDLY